jgi:hypothetical protein
MNLTFSNTKTGSQSRNQGSLALFRMFL